MGDSREKTLDHPQEELGLCGEEGTENGYVSRFNCFFPPPLQNVTQKQFNPFKAMKMALLHKYQCHTLLIAMF